VRRADLKVAVVGAGWIATHAHRPGYNTAGVRIVGLADLALGVARKAAAEFGVERAYRSWRRMLAVEKPDIVSVCVPNVFHREVVTAALEAGAHVLCEKPLATSVGEAQSMFAAATKVGRHLMTEHNLRFRPVNIAIKQRIESGEFGRVYHANAVYIRRLGIPTWGSFTMSRFSHGGSMLDIGVHVIDCAMWFMGSPRPVEVMAQIGARFGNRPEYAAARRNAWDPEAFDVDDFGAAFVRFEDGSTMTVQASWASHVERDREYIHVLGDDAGATNDPGVIYRLIDGERVDEPLEVPRSTGWLEAVEHFVRVVEGKEHLRVLPEETLNVQRVLDACYESSRLGRAVRLDG
jgi:predicted dehydrogenase